MWEIFKAELRYTRFPYFVFLVAITLLVLLQAMSTDGERLYVLWFVIMIAMNFWNAKRIKEKRDFQLAQIPVSRGDVGKARALMMVIVPAAGLGFYVLLTGTLGRGAVEFGPLAFLYGLAVTIYALVFMFRDRFVGTRSLTRGKVVLISVMTLLVAAGIVTMIMTEDAAESGAEPPAIVRAMGAVIRYNPLGNPLYMACFVAGSLLLAYISVITFQRRKTNVEW